MAKIAATPTPLRNYVFTVDVDDFQAATEQVQFQPSFQTQTWTGGDGETHSSASPATWVVNIGHVQDWDTAGSLGEFLLAHEGETMTVVFQPDASAGTGATTFTSEVTIAPSAIGGSNGQYPTSTVALPCTKPVQGVTA